MVLSDHLLRYCDSWDHLLESTVITLRQPDATTMPTRPDRQVQRRLSAAEKVDVARRYQAGTQMKELAALYGVHPSTVSHNLRSLGVPLRRQGLRGNDLPEAARLYDEGWPLSQLGEKYGCHATTIRAALAGYGAKMRLRPGWKY